MRTRFAILVCLLSLAALSSGATFLTPTVGRWDRFEASVTNANAYGNRYNDVTLNVTYTRPDGSTVGFWGFYDGGTTWKIRFMPDQLGTWSYSATFSDGTPGLSGIFICVSSTTPGMLAKDESNPVWFGFKGGGHKLIRSFHVGDRFFASNWSSASRTAFLNWTQTQGYNTLSIASHYLNRNAAGRGAGWDTPDLWPLNAAEYGQLEAILNDLADRRIMVHPFAGFFGRASDFPTNVTDQTRFIKYTLARLGPYWNILLNVAGPEPNLDGYLSATDVNRLGAEIAARDVFDHSLSVHNRVGSDPYKTSSWSSYGTLQGPKTTSLSTLSSGLLSNHHPSKPLYAHEVLWSGNQHHPNYTDTQLRKNAYVINMSAAALNFGDMDSNLADGAGGNSSSGFSGTLDLSQRVQSRHDVVKKVWDFFETIPFWQMSPNQSIVGAGHYCLAAPGSRYLVYMPSRGIANVSVAAGTYTVQWINAQNTIDRRSGGITTTGQGLASPFDGDDWLAYLVVTSGAETLAVTSLTLINADSDLPIAGFDPIPSGATINLAALPTQNLSVAANVSGAVQSVRFGWDGNANYKIENLPPYAIAGDTSGDFNPWTPSPGSHTLTATPYPLDSASGTPGTAVSLSLTVVAGAVNQPPAVNITSPSNGATFTAPAGMTITATAGDADGSIAKVEFFQNGVKLGEDLSSPYTCAWSNVPAGSYALEARARDNAGATATCAHVSITVNPPVAPPPTQTVTLLPSDDAYLENSIRYNDALLRIENTSTRGRASYLKFTLDSLSGPVIGAKLRLKNVDTLSRSGTWKCSRGSHNDWTEGTLSSSNKPLPSTLLAVCSGPIALGSVIDFDVTSAVTGPGTITFVLHMDLGAGNDLKFSSSEGTQAPQLVLTMADTSLAPAYTGSPRITFPHADGDTGPTRERIDVVCIAAGYRTRAQIAALLPRDVREMCASIRRLIPAEFNFWTVIPGRDSTDMLSDLDLWNVARLAPAADYILVIHNGQGQAYANKAARVAHLYNRPAGYLDFAAGHEFAHLFAMLGDEYGAVTELDAQVGDTYRASRAGSVVFRLRAAHEGAAGVASFRISPIPTAVATPGAVAIDNDGDGIADALQWDNVTLAWLSPYGEPWFDVAAYYTQAHEGEYCELEMSLEANADYEVRLMEPTVPARLFAMRVGTEADATSIPNLTASRPASRAEGDKWAGLVGPDPVLNGQIVGWYESGARLYRPTYDGCQMKRAGRAPFCAVCAAAVKEALADPARRDDRGPR